MAGEEGLSSVCVPAEDAAEASLISDLKIIPGHNMGQPAAYLEGLREIPPHDPGDDPISTRPPPYVTDSAEIKGQEYVKRALGSRPLAET